MLHEADQGIFFRAKAELVKKEQDFFVARNYKELKAILDKIV
jgi:hypothetical protein